MASAEFPFAPSIKSAQNFAASPQMNSALSMPFLRAFSLASAMASGTISKPIAFSAFCAKKSVSVPVPQYKSSTRSPPVSAANSSTKPKSLAACTAFTWKNAVGDMPKVSRLIPLSTVRSNLSLPHSRRFFLPKITLLFCPLMFCHTPITCGTRSKRAATISLPREKCSPLVTKITVICPPSPSRTKTWRNSPRLVCSS